MSMVYYFFWDTVYIACTYLPASQRPVTTGSRLLFCTCTTDVGLSVCTWVRPSKCKSGSRDPAHAPLQGNLSFISSPAISPRSKTSLGQNPDISLPDISPLNISRQDISLPGHKPPVHKPLDISRQDISLTRHEPLDISPMDPSLLDISPLNISRQDISLPERKPPGHKPPRHKPSWT